MNTLVEELTPDMMDEGLNKQIAELIGAKNLYKLSELVGGSTIYIPKPESLLRPIRDTHIKSEFNGYNHFELAQKYGISVQWVRQLCGAGEVMGQLDLFQQEN